MDIRNVNRFANAFRPLRLEILEGKEEEGKGVEGKKRGGWKKKEEGEVHHRSLHSPDETLQHKALPLYDFL